MYPAHALAIVALAPYRIVRAMGGFLAELSGTEPQGTAFRRVHVTSDFAKLRPEAIGESHDRADHVEQPSSWRAPVSTTTVTDRLTARRNGQLKLTVSYSQLLRNANSRLARRS